MSERQDRIDKAARAIFAAMHTQHFKDPENPDRVFWLESSALAREAYDRAEAIENERGRRLAGGAE